MILRQLSILFFYLAKTLDAAIPTLSELGESVAQLSIIDDTQVAVIQMEQQRGIKVSFKPQPTLCEVIEQGKMLCADTLNDDIKTIAKKIDTKLVELLDLGVSPLDALPIITSFSNDAKELVLAAVEEEAHTLLKLLQMIYIWRDEAQFHWFQALSYLNPWYDKIMWHTHQMNWGKNIRAVCEADNNILAMKIRREVPSGHALENFDKEILKSCAECDAINVFTSMEMKPAQLEQHFELLVANNSVKLLKLHQVNKGLEYLDLENYPLSSRLPANADDFAFLLHHGQYCFPMSQFIKRACEEGRLDLLKYLYGLERSLVPSGDHLKLAAEKGWVNILMWAHSLEQIDRWELKDCVSILAFHRQFKALDLWVGVDDKTFDKNMINTLIYSGSLEALQWVDERFPISQNHQEYINLAAKCRHLPTLKWLHKKFRVFPGSWDLEESGDSLSRELYLPGKTCNKKLEKSAANNLEFLEWVLENAPPSTADKISDILSKNIFCKESLEWLYTSLKIRPRNMYWACIIGDLEAIQFAIKNCESLLNSAHFRFAARWGHLHVIKGIREKFSEKLPIGDMFKRAIEYGNPEIADYLLPELSLNERTSLYPLPNIGEDKYLATLKWLYEHKFDIVPSESLYTAAERGYLHAIEWLVETFPEIEPIPRFMNSLAKHGYHVIYKRFLGKYLDKHLDKDYQSGLLWSDIRSAYFAGHLEVVKAILDKDPLLAHHIPTLPMDRCRYHIKQWLIKNDKWP